MAKKYRKKPVVIEAVRLGWDTWGEICEFVGVGAEEGKPKGVYLDENGVPQERISETIGLEIPTLEGVMIGQQGDFIVKGIQGEFYPCKPDIFEATYEEVK